MHNLVFSMQRRIYLQKNNVFKYNFIDNFIDLDDEDFGKNEEQSPANKLATYIYCIFFLLCIIKYLNNLPIFG